MTNFMNRARDKAQGYDLPDTTVLRARVMAAVEEALDRAEDAWNDAPSAKDAAGRVRDSRAAEATVASAERVRSSRAGEAAVTAVAAVLPLAASFLRDRAKSKAAMRAARIAPIAMRAHPVLLGASVVGGVALGVAAVRRMQSEGSRDDDAHDELSGSAKTSMDNQVSRMEGEGGDLGAYDGTPTPLRRFVRTTDEESSNSN